jgi:hypothetical protein
MPMSIHCDGYKMNYIITKCQLSYNCFKTILQLQCNQPSYNKMSTILQLFYNVNTCDKCMHQIDTMWHNLIHSCNFFIYNILVVLKIT